MLDWLLSPIDAERAHDVGFAISWHARSMVLGWGFLAPFSILVARFFKVMPGQNWPGELDNQLWWRSHWMGHSLVLLLSVFGFALVLPADWEQMTLHRWCGYGVLLLLVCQVSLGLMRGSKGGPTALAPDGTPRGDHYDMTPRRRGFEVFHKTIGYGVLLLSVVTIVLGLWDANGPRWMWLLLVIWWLTFIGFFIALQHMGRALDTYQAIWGTDISHPGNQGADPGWGMRRVQNKTRDQ